MSDPVLAGKVSGIWEEKFVSTVRSRVQSMFFQVLSGHSEMKCASLCTLMYKSIFMLQMADTSQSPTSAAASF